MVEKIVSNITLTNNTKYLFVFKKKYENKIDSLFIIIILFIYVNYLIIFFYDVEKYIYYLFILLN